MIVVFAENFRPGGGARPVDAVNIDIFPSAVSEKFQAPRPY